MFLPDLRVWSLLSNRARDEGNPAKRGTDGRFSAAC